MPGKKIMDGPKYPTMTSNECCYLHSLGHINTFLSALKWDPNRSSLVNISDTLMFTEMYLIMVKGTYMYLTRPVFWAK